MKTVIKFLSYFFVLIVGLGAGFYFGLVSGQSREFAYEMIETGNFYAYMDLQMREGTDAAREEALHGFLALIEKRKGQQSTLLTEKIFATDSALTNARLAALAKKRGADHEAQQYLDRAASFCPQTGWHDCTAEKIVYMVQRLDKQGIFGAKSAE